MKNIFNNIIRFGRVIAAMSLLFLVASCSNIDQTVVTDVETASFMVTDSWICELRSFEEDGWRYLLHAEDNGDYVAISDTRILRVSKDGILTSMISPVLPSDETSVFKVFNGKIYRFYYINDFQDFDAFAKVSLQIYDLDFNLLSDTELETNGLVYDVEIENDNLFGMLVYNVDTYTMTLRKLNISGDLISEIVLSDSGTSPTNLHITEVGDYFCTASSSRDNFIYLDNDLNLLVETEFSDYTISDAKYIDGRGFYITGRVTPFADPDRPTAVALIDLDGNQVNSVTFDQGERWSPYMEINHEKICLMQSEPESGKDMLLTFLDYDLNIESNIEIPGNVAISDFVLNENNSFSFVYGFPLNPDDSEFFPERFTRIFKFDGSYTLPTNIIVQ